jgi:hypothetical protein
MLHVDFGLVLPRLHPAGERADRLGGAILDAARPD